MKTTEYLDQVKARYSIPSDYALSKRLQVPTQTVSNWRTGARQPDNLACFRLAELLQLPADRVIADIELERAERTGQADQAAAWRQWLERLGGVAASLLGAVILSGTLGAGNARADNGLRSFGGDATKPMSARTRRRRRGATQAFAVIAETLAQSKRRRALC